MVSTFLRGFRGSTDEIARRVQAIGLTAAATLVSKILHQPVPSEDGFPLWVEEILAHVIGALCDYGKDHPPAAQIGALEASLRFVGGMPPETRQEFQALLILIEVGPLILGPQRRRFSELTNTDRKAHLMRWEGAEIPALKGGFRAVKSVAMMGYWSRPETFSFIGYSVAKNPGVPLMQRREWAQREKAVVPPEKGDGAS